VWCGSAIPCAVSAGPNNAVFVAGRPVAWIDFDFAAPGDPIEDVAYLAWSWCISGRPDRGPAAEQRFVAENAPVFRAALDADPLA
jgi:aminoglycoside phosphotransferase (APT) family kinase protein